MNIEQSNQSNSREQAPEPSVEEAQEKRKKILLDIAEGCERMGYRYALLYGLGRSNFVDEAGLDKAMIEKLWQGRVQIVIQNIKRSYLELEDEQSLIEKAFLLRSIIGHEAAHMAFDLKELGILEDISRALNELYLQYLDCERAYVQAVANNIYLPTDEDREKLLKVAREKQDFENRRVEQEKKGGQEIQRDYRPLVLQAKKLCEKYLDDPRFNVDLDEIAKNVWEEVKKCLGQEAEKFQKVEAVSAKKYESSMLKF